MRRSHVVVLSLLIAFAGLAGPTHGLPDTGPTGGLERRVAVTLTASSAWVRRGGKVVLTGTVTGARGRSSVTILQRLKGKRGWKVETRERTSRQGRFRHSEDINAGTRDYKACVKRRCSRAVTVHMGAQPARGTSVTLETLAPTSIEAGQAFTASGAASGNLNGRAVQIQGYDAGSKSWSPVGSGTVAGGRWSGTATITTAGRAVPVRVAFPGAIGLASSSSNAGSLTVYGWEYLYDRDPVEYYEYDNGSWAVNGTTYAKSVGMYSYHGDTSYLEYNLGRSCIRLAATVGFDDTASTEVRSTVRVLTDSVTRWTQGGVRLGQSFPIVLDVTSGLRLRLEDTETTSADGTLVFGDVRVLCAS